MRNGKFVEFSGIWKTSREDLPHLHDVHQQLMALREELLWQLQQQR